jgi:hypothetical protein
MVEAFWAFIALTALAVFLHIVMLTVLDGMRMDDHDRRYRPRY